MRLNDWPYVVFAVAFLAGIAVPLFRLPWLLLLLAGVALSAAGVLIVANHNGVAAHMAKRHLNDAKNSEALRVQLGESFFSTRGLRGLGVYLIPGGVMFSGIALLSSDVPNLMQIGMLLVPACAFLGIAWFLVSLIWGGRGGHKRS